MNNQRCNNCKFYHLEHQTVTDLADNPIDPADFESECRRYPPVRGDEAVLGFVAVVNFEPLCDCFIGPVVRSTNWCGEWRRRAK